MMHSADTPEIPEVPERLRWRNCRSCGYEQPFQPYLSYDDDPIWNSEVEIDHLRQIVDWSNTKIVEYENLVDSMFDDQDKIATELYDAEQNLKSATAEINRLRKLVNEKNDAINQALASQSRCLNYIDTLHERLKQSLLPDDS